MSLDPRLSKNEWNGRVRRSGRIRSLPIMLAFVASMACERRSDRDVVPHGATDSLTPAKGPPVSIAAPAEVPTNSLRENRDAEHVGQHIPEHLSSMGAPVALMESATFRDSSAERALFHVAVSDEGEEVWLLEHLPRFRPDDPTGWTVLATLAPLDSLSSGLRLMLGCARAGIPNRRLIAEVEWEDSPTLRKIPRAWEAHGRTIVGVPTTGITCTNEIVPD